MTITSGLRRRALLGALAVVSALAALPAGTASAALALPFPDKPGEFLATGTRTVFGAQIPLTSATPEATLRLAGQSPVKAAGTGTLTVVPGQGRTHVGRNAIQQSVGMSMYLSDLSMDFPGQAAGDLALRLDAGRPTPPSGLSVLDPDRCSKRFTELFHNPLKWPALTAEHNRDPVAFYKHYLPIFYPARNDLHANVNATSTKFPGVTLINKHTIALTNTNIRRFPPAGAAYALSAPIELVDAKHPDGPTLITIEQMNTTLTHTPSP
ncbi:hypothetical protein AB0K48_06425 [Nonomuraea sp. NPDC055795]